MHCQCQHSYHPFQIITAADLLLMVNALTLQEDCTGDKSLTHITLQGVVALRHADIAVVLTQPLSYSAPVLYLS